MIDKTQLTEEILAIHKLDRQAHLNTDVKSAISIFDPSYIYVRDGNIHRFSSEDLELMYTSYFQGAAFHEWDDLEPAVIHVSDDGKMAWVIEHFRIRLSRQENEKVKEQTSEYAGMTIYEKKEGKWLRVANTSTFAKTKIKSRSRKTKSGWFKFLLVLHMNFSDPERTGKSKILWGIAGGSIAKRGTQTPFPPGKSSLR